MLHVISSKLQQYNTASAIFYYWLLSASYLLLRTMKFCSVLFSSAYSLHGWQSVVNRRALQLLYPTAPTTVNC